MDRNGIVVADDELENYLSVNWAQNLAELIAQDEEAK